MKKTPGETRVFFVYYFCFPNILSRIVFVKFFCLYHLLQRAIFRDIIIGMIQKGVFDMQNDLMYELTQRGFINQCSNMDAVADLLDNGQIAVYLGSDPTADSLHVGHLVPVMMMRWLQKYGHKPLMLVGGATGRIGDPSGRDTGRPMMTEDVLQKNIAGLKKSYSKFLRFGSGASDALIVDNYDWMRGYSHLDFLAQYGLDFTIPRMLSMESVKKRLENGMTFLEFNYMTFQAVDFLTLYKEHNCVLQLCGADQWGNAIMGVELIRKKMGKELIEWVDTCFQQS